MWWRSARGASIACSRPRADSIGVGRGHQRGELASTNPKKSHEHWHIDIYYVNIYETFYFVISLLDGYSRDLVHCELRESMKEFDTEITVQRGIEKYPGEHPGIISDNGAQFISRDFKELIRIVGLTHARTSPHYPQSNRKKGRWYGSLKRECLRLACPATVDEARRRMMSYVDRYNHVRLHSAIGYITPFDKLSGRVRDRRRA